MLGAQAREFLESGGWSIGREMAGLIDATRQSGGGAERLLLWVDERRLAPADGSQAANREAREADEQRRLAVIAREMGSTPSARGQYLVWSRQGYSQRFVSEITRLLGEGGMRVPVQFFDAAYAQDGVAGRRARGVLADLLTRAEADKGRRIAQPFSVRRSLDDAEGTPGGDIVEHLETALADPPDRPRLFVVDGSAGGGKSFAFNDLVRRLYHEFIAAKQRQVARLRPVVFLPEYLRESDQIGYVGDLVGAVSRTEMGGAVPPEQLKWLARNGHAVWMFDGLDEFYDGSADFFPFLAGLLTDPASRAQVLVCTRDSLLTSSGRLRRFLGDLVTTGGHLEICELRPWGPASWRDIAHLELEQGRKGAEASPRVDAFLATVSASPEIAEVASLPFYCSILIEQFKRHGSLVDPARPTGGLMATVRQLLRADGKPLGDELDVLDLVAERMLDREHGKSLFRWRDFVDADVISQAARIEEALGEATRLTDPEDAAMARAMLAEIAAGGEDSPVARVLEAAGRRSLTELIGSVAWARRRCGVGGEPGFPAADLAGPLADASGAAAEAEVQTSRVSRVLVQLAFFGAGRQAGDLDFSHPILADYLAARFASGILRDYAAAYAGGQMSPEAADAAVRNSIGTAELAPSGVFERFLLREAGRDAALATLLRDARDRGRITMPAVAGLLARVA